MKKLVIIETAIILAIIAVKFYIEIIAFFPSCYFRENYGIFCPSCNFTSCIIALSNFDILLALKYQPILTIALIYLFAINILYIFNTLTGKNIGKKLYPKPWYAIIFAVLLMLYSIYMNVLVF